MGQINQEYGIKKKPDQKIQLITEERTTIAQIFSFFHEVGHVRLWQKTEAAEQLKKIIRSMFSELKREHFDRLGQWAELSYIMAAEIVQGKHQSLMEELVADIYAAERLQTFLEHRKQLMGFRQICDVLVSVNTVLLFQNLFNVVVKAWEKHYTELRFGLTLKQHEVDQHVNEIETVRGGLGHILVSVVLMQNFGLNHEEREKAWNICGREHINNSEAMECLASESFICTAIREAME